MKVTLTIWDGFSKEHEILVAGRTVVVPVAVQNDEVRSFEFTLTHGGDATRIPEYTLTKIVTILDPAAASTGETT